MAAEYTLVPVEPPPPPPDYCFCGHEVTRFHNHPDNSCGFPGCWCEGVDLMCLTCRDPRSLHIDSGCQATHPYVEGICGCTAYPQPAS